MSSLQFSDLRHLVALCKRRGIVFASSEIYGGIGNTYDYGHYGVLLKQNVKQQWWNSMVYEHENIIGLDSAIIQNPKVWQASGHLQGFSDPLVQCLGKCKKRWRLDHLQEAAELNGEDPKSVVCPACSGQLSDAKDFNLMFKTHMGPVAEEKNAVYLRPETAQGIFVNFKQMYNTYNQSLPLGIAQIGKSFRNEISPGQFIFRMREFEQMEMEFFVLPEQTTKWYEYWQKTRLQWYIDLGIDPSHLRLRPHEQEELAHYSHRTSDIEYLFPMGWSELEGIADRSDHDLQAHAKASKQKLFVRDSKGKEVMPHVIEPAAGLDRAVLALLADAYREEKLPDGQSRVYLKFHNQIAPVKAAVFPLLRKDGQPQVAKEIYQELKKQFVTEYDEKGHIGKRYRRQDEIGTPWCITVDHQTLEDQTVTLRHRDSMKQQRVHRANIQTVIQQSLTPRRCLF